ncbi:hypothetical protein [Neoroseomonas oryzicola]|uniref:Uncharacterized protein n=1 Tax=Neoroseomonas oryzicola TaxID=535904 RepID=A0A9X9WLY6_9PROT|nr:hypothetical protein [Neoroseomonas oryzicola]MBR0661346.1 hypothetical protein [Neoroseomonas oryzicola]NKE18836.1 hypothetical protein [Neoroseomonas oryzicola]
MSDDFPLPPPDVFNAMIDRQLMAEARFYEALGRAIAWWAHVEMSLLLAYLVALKPAEEAPGWPHDRSAAEAAAQFSVILGFEGKLSLARRVIESRAAGTPFFDEWSKLCGVIDKRQRRRNQLAHYMVIGSSEGPDSPLVLRRSVMVPQVLAINAKTNRWRRLAQEPETIRQVDLDMARRDFGDLSMAIESFAARLDRQDDGHAPIAAQVLGIAEADLARHPKDQR